MRREGMIAGAFSTHFPACPGAPGHFVIDRLPGQARKETFMKKTAVVLIIAAAVLLSSCSYSGPSGHTGTSGASEGTQAAAPSELTGDLTAVSGDSGDPSAQTGAALPQTEDVSAQTEEPSAQTEAPSPVWDPVIRAEAIEKIKATLPKHDPADRFTMTLNAALDGTIFISSLKYVSEELDINVAVYNGGAETVETRRVELVVAMNNSDGTLWIAISIDRPKGMINQSLVLVDLAPDSNGFRLFDGKPGYPRLALSEPAAIGSVLDALGYGYYLGDGAEQIADGLDSLLRSVDPSLSVEQLGLYARVR